jgi:O-antigen/teichoic acid export membrane protein
MGMRVGLTSFKRNIIASYIANIYVTLTAIVLVPLYVRYMGAEAYGLIGFYAMLQSWFVMLDMGLTPTMSREIARFRGHGVDTSGLRILLRIMEGLFVIIGLVGASAIISGSGFIAASWLNIQELPYVEVRNSLMLVGVIIALKLISDLYRGIINGFERLVWLAAFNAATATLRCMLVIPLFFFIGRRPTQFFVYQLVCAAVELAILANEAYRLLPKAPNSQSLPWSLQPLVGIMRFSLALAFSGAVWAVVTQTDKLVLSKLLPLTEYGYFTLAVLIAGGVMAISTPISGVIMPRMAVLHAEGNEAELIRVYRSSTQLVALIVVPATLVLVFCAEKVLWVWTGDLQIAQRAARVLTLYALGNGIMALGAFPYYLQYARGDLGLHMAGSGLFLSLLIPVLIWATKQYGINGAGYAWLWANLAYFCCWVPIVHRRFIKGLHKIWLIDDLAVIVAGAALAAAVVSPRLRWPLSRLSSAFTILDFSLILLVVTATTSSRVRHFAIAQWRTLLRRDKT